MKLKEEFNYLVSNVKNTYRQSGQKITNEAIGKRLGLSRSYFSGLLGGSEEVKQKHIDDFKAHFKEELKGIIKPSTPGAPENMQLAMLKMLYQRVAKAESARLGIPIDKVMEEMDAETMIAWKDLNDEK